LFNGRKKDAKKSNNLGAYVHTNKTQWLFNPSHFKAILVMQAMTGICKRIEWI
jgi:hypothetical protein